MKLLSDAKIQGKAVLVRLDLDLPKTQDGFDTTRLEQGIPTVKYLLKHGASRVKIIAHRGRPKAESTQYSLARIEAALREHFTAEEQEKLEVGKNLRFDPREEKGSLQMAKTLAKGFDFYVLDAFATAHREHTSITFVPQVLPTYPGLQLQKEIQAFSRVLQSPKRPFLVILGGAKLETKMPLIQALEAKADVILVGGKLALEAKDNPVLGRKIIVAELTKDGKDITQAAVDQFIRFIKAAGTVIWNGPMGVYEDPAHAKGTKQIAIAINEASAFTITGGGDTEAAQTLFRAQDKVSHLSTGGGAMLDYLLYGTLPGIEAILTSQKAFKLTH